MCCDSWCRKELDTTGRLNRTECRTSLEIKHTCTNMYKMGVFQRSTCGSRKLWENFVTAIHAIIFCKISHKPMESVFCYLLLRLKKKKKKKDLQIAKASWHKDS